MSNNLLIFILIILVLLYSFFSACETAFSSLNRVKLKSLATTDSRAQKTLLLLDKFPKLLTTILIGNTIVNVVSASLATVLFCRFYENGVAISSIIMTLVIMIIGEILPKNIAKRIPEKFAISVTSFLSLLVLIFSPLTFVFNKINKLLNSKLEETDDYYSTEELITIVEEANEEGGIDDHEANLITNALEFNDLDVGEIFKPRIDVVAVDINTDSIDDIEKLYRDSGYSRLPVYEDNLDNVIGILHEKDFYYHLLYEKSTNVRELVKDVIYTSPHVKISTLLKQLQTNKAHMAIVCDEYGGTEGIITMENILEELVGEIYDEHDEIVEYYKEIDENVYLIKCDLDIDDLFEHFKIIKKEDYDYNTTSAWVIDMLDKIPNVGDNFDYCNMHIEVTDADEKKVNEIKLTIMPSDDSKESK